MNKYEKGYKRIIRELDKIDMFYLAQERIDYLKLVERATPKKVIDDECPNCKSITGTCEQDYSGDYIKFHNHCTNCGQALDKSE